MHVHTLSNCMYMYVYYILYIQGGAVGGKVAISDVVKVTPAQGDDETFEIVFAGHGSPWLLRAFTKVHHQPIELHVHTPYTGIQHYGHLEP